ncbi:MAG: SusD/RagB family nutrient-binding outer membrane lipoprotein, partial [Bergeyella zoohelcum]|nr:SusD/RagB family nutrient-binding outer membrane lipoprotein [Bergeyella zoohelcum]
YAGHRGQPLDYALYNITPSSTDGVWRYMYKVAKDLKEIEEKGTASGDKVYAGIAQILNAYTLSVMTDLFGDIPYSEALQGSQNITPKYDTQESIYKALIASIDSGIANIKTGQGTLPGSDDFIFNGNVTKWERFANSLKLRLYNHMSAVDASAAATFLATSPALIEDSSNDAKVPFHSTASNSNPIYQFDALSGRADQAVASTIVDKMKSLNDPRLSLYFAGVANNEAGLQGQIIGNTPGGTVEDAGMNLYSRVGSAYASANSPVTLITAAEVNFIKAEIYYRVGNTAQAQAAYEEAIKQDFNALGVSSSYSSYIVSTDVAYNNTLQRIMEQKWITMYQAAYESWVDWRRTSYPVLTIPTGARTGTFIPRRLPYPQVEINVNSASLAAGPGIPVLFQGMKDRMWWDKN